MKFSMNHETPPVSVIRYRYALRRALPPAPAAHTSTATDQQAVAPAATSTQTATTAPTSTPTSRPVLHLRHQPTAHSSPGRGILP